MWFPFHLIMFESLHFLAKNDSINGWMNECNIYCNIFGTPDILFPLTIFSRATCDIIPLSLRFYMWILKWNYGFFFECWWCMYRECDAMKKSSNTRFSFHFVRTFSTKNAWIAINKLNTARIKSPLIFHTVIIIIIMLLFYY